MTAKRLKSADIIVFPQRARVAVYNVAQIAAGLPLEDRENYIERDLARYLEFAESIYPADIAWAQVKDLEETIRHFMSGMKKSKKRKSQAATHHHHRGARTT